MEERKKDMENPKKRKEGEGEGKEERGMEEVFKDLKFSSHEPLNTKERVNCPKCNKKAKWYCVDCCLKVIEEIPNLHLPISLDM